MAGKIRITSVAFPDGNNKTIQYNNDGYFGGATQLFWDNVNDRLGVGVPAPVKSFHVRATSTSNNYDNTILLEDDRAQAIGRGGGITFGGKYTNGDSYTVGGFIRLEKQNATSGNYGFDLILGGRIHGADTLARVIRIHNNNVGIGDDSTPAQQLSLTKCMELLATTGSGVGVIYKGANRFIHDYDPPVNAGAIDPQGKNLFVGELAGNFGMGSTATETYHSSKNVGVGYNTLNDLTTGYGNLAFGCDALSFCTTGMFNCGFGREALKSVTTGRYNIALGSRALYQGNNNDYNIAIGADAGMGTGGQSLHKNVLIGYRAGYILTTGGDNNILIGYKAGDNITSGEKNIVIGYDLNALVAASDYQLNIGSLIFGTLGATKCIGINTSTMNETLNVGGAIRLETSALTNAGTIRWNGTNFQGYKDAAWVNLDSSGGSPGGADTQVQFNDSSAFGGDAGLIYNKTIDKLTVGVHWHANYPFDSYQPALEGISEIGEWGVLGASRSSDSAVQDSMRCLGLYGFVYNDSHNSAYGIYTEARKMVSTPNRSTSGAEFVILNRYNSQVDVTQSVNPGQATYGVAITSGTTYDAVTDYDASVGLFFAAVNAKFRRGIVMHNGSLRDLGGGKYVGIALPSGARLAWVDDNNCIMGTTTTIDTLIANNIITQHAATKFKVNQNIQLPNNKHLTGLTTGSVIKDIIGINASNAVEIATNVIGLVTIGYNGTLDDAIMIRVNGANKTIHTGIADSGGTGYRTLIVDN